MIRFLFINILSTAFIFNILSDTGAAYLDAAIANPNASGVITNLQNYVNTGPTTPIFNNRILYHYFNSTSAMQAMINLTSNSGAGPVTVNYFNNILKVIFQNGQAVNLVRTGAAHPQPTMNYSFLIKANADIISNWYDNPVNIPAYFPYAVRAQNYVDRPSLEALMNEIIAYPHGQQILYDVNNYITNSTTPGTPFNITLPELSVSILNENGAAFLDQLFNPINSPVPDNFDEIVRAKYEESDGKVSLQNLIDMLALPRYKNGQLAINGVNSALSNIATLSPRMTLDTLTAPYASITASFFTPSNDSAANSNLIPSVKPVSFSDFVVAKFLEPNGLDELKSLVSALLKLSDQDSTDGKNSYAKPAADAIIHVLVPTYLQLPNLDFASLTQEFLGTVTEDPEIVAMRNRVGVVLKKSKLLGSIKEVLSNYNSSVEEIFSKLDLATQQDFAMSLLSHINDFVLLHLDTIAQSVSSESGRTLLRLYYHLYGVLKILSDKRLGAIQLGAIQSDMIQSDMIQSDNLLTFDQLQKFIQDQNILNSKIAALDKNNKQDNIQTQIEKDALALDQSFENRNKAGLEQIKGMLTGIKFDLLEEKDAIALYHRILLILDASFSTQQPDIILKEYEKQYLTDIYNKLQSIDIEKMQSEKKALETDKIGKGSAKLAINSSTVNKVNTKSDSLTDIWLQKNRADLHSFIENSILQKA